MEGLFAEQVQKVFIPLRARQFIQRLLELVIIFFVCRNDKAARRNRDISAARRRLLEDENFCSGVRRCDRCIRTRTSVSLFHFGISSACATSIATLIPTGAAASDKELLSKFRLVVICLSLTMWLGSLLYIPNFWESQRLILCATKTQQYEQRQ